VTAWPATRRQALAGLGAALGATLTSIALPPLARGQSNIRDYRLRAAPATVNLVGPDGPPTDVWSYNGAIPGPLIRARQGERVRVHFENALEQPTTVHGTASAWPTPWTECRS
jgi:FtsP/CotA-like multicopper oxidase with cupredoxin domain